jgi:pimeloyl-ACP methyl ester carboxylesterase
MKKLFISVITLFMVSQLHAQDIAGSWMGAISIGSVKLHLVFNIKKMPDGSYTSNFDSPDQNAFGIACSKTGMVKDSLIIEIAIIKGGYRGLWDGKDEIAGTYTQGGRGIAMQLKRITADEKAALSKHKVRPQTPKPPFDYVSEEIEYDNADKSLHYGATFTRPKGDGKFPAVIIISGSGTQDRDGTIFGHKLYWVLADYLTKNGIAVLRVDDRGAGKSTLGDISKATSADFSYDVEASLNYLETRADVDRKHLGLIGHSEGGMIAPMVAARRKDISFIVLWGASAVGGAQINVEQNAYALKMAGIDSNAVAAFVKLHTQELALFASSANQETLDKQVSEVFEAWKKQQSQQVLDALYVQGNSIVKQDVFALYNSLYNNAWMRFFISYKPEKDLAKVTCSVLAVNGTKDTQVDAASNLAKIREVLTKSGNKHFETKALPGLNHLLQTAGTGDLSEYEKIDETMSPVAMNIICSWIKIQTK